MVPWFWTRAEGVKPPGWRIRGIQLLISYQLVVLQLFGVDTLRVVDGAINLPHAHTLGSKPVQVSHGVKTHVPKALREQTDFNQLWLLENSSDVFI